MATVEKNSICTSRRAASPGEMSSSMVRLHRVATVRRQQGLSLRSAARQMGVDIRRLREQEGQRVLGVPISELLEEPDTPLSRPVLERAQMVRIMKTVKALMEAAKNKGTERLATSLVTQLVELMPELQDVGPWHSVGQRRSLDEFGRAAERSISDDVFFRADWR